MGSRIRKLTAAVLALTLCLGLCSLARAAELSVYCEPASAMPGDTVTFYLKISNPTGNTMSNLSFQSAYTGFSFSGPNAVAPGEQGLYSGTLAVPETMLDVPMEFALHWEYFDMNGASQGTDNARATVTLPRGTGTDTPAAELLPGGDTVSVTRTADSTQASKGETITLTYTVINAGAEPITALSIKDAALSSKELVTDITVEPGATYTFEYAYTMGSETVTSLPVVSYTAGGETKSASVQKELVLGMVNTRLTVKVEQGTPTAEGVTFTLYLSNNGNQKISKIKIKDEAGNSVNNETFALSVGESKTLTYSVSNEEEHNVVFYLTGSSASGESYEDNTNTYTVRRYIDPSLIGLDFSATVLETLNAAGSIRVRFTVNNTGSLPLQNLLLSEAELGELRRQESVPLGETVLEETVNVGSPRDLVFTLNVQDEARNDYTYTANITAAYVGVEQQGTAASTTGNVIDEIETIGTKIGDSVSNALTVALVVLGVLCVLSAGAFIALGILENRQKEEARRRANRERRLRAQAAAEGRAVPESGRPMRGDPYAARGDTRVSPRRDPRA